MRDPLGRCDVDWSGPHQITDVRSAVSVVINDDGVSRHVSHLRFVPNKSPVEDFSDAESQDESDGLDHVEEQQAPNGNNTSTDCLRRSARVRNPPAWTADYVMD